MRLRRWLPIACLAAGFSVAGTAWWGGLARGAAEPDTASQEASGRDLVPLPTLGGAQLWADELFFHRWRIQRKAHSDQCRLLDEHNLRHASGTFAQCRAVLEQIKRQRKLPPMQGRGVLVLHGIADTRAVMNPLCRYLEEKGGYQVFNVSYPSTRQGIAEHAKSLASIVDHLEGIEEIHFVGYSLGNIVIRRFFADHLKRNAGRPDPRFKRTVMLGPPNHGSELATTLGDNALFELLLGKTGQQLGPLWAWEAGSLATPPGEFGIIAGGCSDDRGFNPLLPGDDDGIVTVASTRLAGASDFVLVPALHALLPGEPLVHQYTLRFLQHGYFLAPDRRNPLPAETNKQQHPMQ